MAAHGLVELDHAGRSKLLTAFGRPSYWIEMAYASLFEEQSDFHLPPAKSGTRSSKRVLW